MTDIEKLRDDVIKAARAWAGGDFRYANDLSEAVRALDAAMRPDPWALLAETETLLPTSPTRAKVFMALAWRQENPDA